MSVDKWLKMTEKHLKERVYHWKMNFILDGRHKLEIEKHKLF